MPLGSSILIDILLFSLFPEGKDEAYIFIILINVP
jgi:hypothetical protein